MLKIFLRLFILLTIAYAVGVNLVERAVLKYFDTEIALYNDELLRGQVNTLLTVLRPQSPEQRLAQLAIWQPDYGLQLRLLDRSDLTLTEGEQIKLRAGQFISRDKYTHFIAPLDPPAGRQYLDINFPPEPPRFSYANISAYLLLAALLGATLLIWVRPHWRDLEVLRAAANRFGTGDFAARAAVSKRSNVRELAEHFNHMAERTQQMIAAQRELTNAVSHELRTPIARLAFEIDLLANVDDEPARGQLLDEMRDDLRELEDMVSELLTYARLEHPQLKLVAESVDAQNWLASVVGALALEAEANGIECHIVADAVATIYIEPRFMARAVLNLLRNAIHYAQRRVELHIQFFAAGEYELWVDDDGPGIPAADRERIFEPFTRLDESRNRATGGVGLGLAIVRRIAEWHRGGITVTDSPLGGARFILRWPSAGHR